MRVRVRVRVKGEGEGWGEAGGGHPEEEPGEALEVRLGRGVLGEEAAQEAPVGRDPRTGAHHDQVGGGVALGDEHDLAHGARDSYLVARPSVAPGEGGGGR